MSHFECTPYFSCLSLVDYGQREPSHCHKVCTEKFCGDGSRRHLVWRIGLVPGHIELDGDSAPSPQKGKPPIFGPYRLWPNGWMDQDATWYEDRRRPRPHYVTWGPMQLPHGAQPPIFGPRLLWSDGWLDQYATWYGGKHRSRRHCVRWGTHAAPPKRGSPHFSAGVNCGQTAGWMPLGTKVGLGPGHIMLMGPRSPSQKGAQPPIFGPCLLWPNGRPCQVLLRTCLSLLSVTDINIVHYFIPNNNWAATQDGRTALLYSVYPMCTIERKEPVVGTKQNIHINKQNAEINTDVELLYKLLQQCCNLMHCAVQTGRL